MKTNAMKTNKTNANEMVSVTIRTTVRLKDVPQILNKQGTQLISIETIPVLKQRPTSAHMPSLFRDLRRLELYPNKKLSRPRNLTTKLPPKYKAKAPSAESFTSKFLKVFTEAPTRNFDAQTLRQKLHDIGSHSSVSTAVGNVNRVHADAIQKNLDGTFCLRPLE